ncbi:MAG TPA: hypothetical protein VEC06_17705 [Paucimonas sp.]|nr:hypothetical protein [Paucimonas sp.]
MTLIKRSLSRVPSVFARMRAWNKSAQTKRRLLQRLRAPSFIAPASSDMMLPMKRLLLIFLLAWLPFQFVWAAAAPYCQHEEKMTSFHLGHHSHPSDDCSVKEPTPDDDTSSFTTHEDCAYCHLGCQVSFLMTASDMTVPLGTTHAGLHPPAFSSHIPDGPQRPDRRLVA